MADKKAVIPVERIETRIFLIQAVKRDIERFPEDLMLQLDVDEFTNLKSQIVISSWGGARCAALLKIYPIRYN